MQTLVADSIGRFDREQWDRCFPGELEAWDYYMATEEAGLAGFELCYPSLWRDGRLLCVAPAFFTKYRLDTTVSGRWKRVTDRIAVLFPGLLSLSMACLGSPVGEVCHLGFAPEVRPEDRPALLIRLMEAFEEHAGTRGVGFVAVKDAPEAAMDLWRVCLAAGYQCIPSLPTAYLPIRFDSLDGYLATLSRATRKDLRRKQRAGDQLTVEWRHDIEDVLPEVLDIYRETLARTDVVFEELTPDYFRGVLRRMGDRASCVLYRVGGRLAGFNLVLHDRHRLIDKFIGLREGLGRQVNLYFISWLGNVGYCIDHGIPLYHSGQAEYGVKLRLGSELAPNWLLFRHRNPLLNWLLRLIAQLVRVDRYDADVAAVTGGVEP